PQHRPARDLHRRPLERRRAAGVDHGPDRRDDCLPELQHEESPQRGGRPLGEGEPGSAPTRSGELTGGGGGGRPRAGGGCRRHREMLLLATLVVCLTFVLRVRPDGRVALPGLAEYPLPETCLSQLWFGRKCPGCGLTRSFIFLAHADWPASWRLHRLGWLLA